MVCPSLGAVNRFLATEWGMNLSSALFFWEDCPALPYLPFCFELIDIV